MAREKNVYGPANFVESFVLFLLAGKLLSLIAIKLFYDNNNKMW